MGPGVALLTAVMRHYQQITGRQLSTDRIMAWHVRFALGDALWRSEAGIPLADHRTPPEWVDDLAARFSMLGIDPEAPRPAIHVRERQASPWPELVRQVVRSIEQLAIFGAIPVPSGPSCSPNWSHRAYPGASTGGPVRPVVADQRLNSRSVPVVPRSCFAPYKRGVTGSNPVAPTRANTLTAILKLAADHHSRPQSSDHWLPPRSARILTGPSRRLPWPRAADGSPSPGKQVSRAAEGHRYFEAGEAAHRNRQLRACAIQRVGTVRAAVPDE
jgi:hypothetical protein